jgi:hypothetical protein
MMEQYINLIGKMENSKQAKLSGRMEICTKGKHPLGFHMGKESLKYNRKYMKENFIKERLFKDLL